MARTVFEWVRCRRRGLLTLWLAAATLPVAAQTPMRPEIDRIFASYDRHDSPGCALGVIQKGRHVYARGYGLANLEHGIPISLDTVFRIGSTSKQFAAFAILLLEADGELSRSDDVRELIPELPTYDAPITIGHLIHHTSGLRDYLSLMHLSGKRGADYYTDAEVLDLLSRQHALNFTPGSEHLYSNSGYFLLSVLVERASGSSLATFAQERIFAPLEMHDTHFHDDHRRLVKRRAAGHAPEGSGWRISQTTLPMVGDGGVFTTTRDLLRWDQSFYRNELGPATLHAWQHETGKLDSGEDTGYAAGLRLGTYRSARTVSHGGAFVGYRAELLRFPELATSISVLCNVSSSSPSALARRVADVVLDGVLGDAPPDATGERSSPSEAKGADTAEIALDAAERSRIEGRYHSEELDATYLIAGSDQGLRLAHENHELDLFPEVLSPIAPDAFRSGPYRVELLREDDVITGFTLTAGRVKNLRFERRAEP